MKISSVDPSNNKLNKSFTVFTKTKSLDIAREAKEAFLDWKNLGVSKRAAYLRNLSKVLREKKEDYARLITIEMGKPIGQSLSEVEKCAWTADFFADKSEKWLSDEPIEMDGQKAFLSFEPIGEVLAIMPWNFPFWQALRCAIPALVAGNVVVLRHSNIVPLCALAIEKAFSLAEFPENVFRTTITDHTVVDELIKSRYVDGVSITGSVETGRTVAKIAGESLKKCVLELGGSDPFIVLEDADVELACKSAFTSRLISNGQSCICAKRFIVIKERFNEFVSKFVSLMSAAKIGTPLDRFTDVGPLASAQQLKTIEAQVNDAKKKGAKIECGGKRLGDKGFFFEPTVITNVKSDMRIAKEEVFGPVAVILPARNEQEVLQIANDSNFGLGGSVWTTDSKKGERMARALESGMIYVNDFTKSDPRIPFGGVKDSGIGRELSRYGLLEFINIKPIILK